LLLRQYKGAYILFMAIAEVNVARLQPHTDQFDVLEFQAAVNPLIDLAGGRRIFRGLLGQITENLPLRGLELSSQYVMNITVWPTINTLVNFTEERSNIRTLLSYQHLFVRVKKPASLALWVVENDATPTIEESAEKLQYLRDNGPSQIVFDSKTRSIFAPTS